MGLASPLISINMMKEKISRWDKVRENHIITNVTDPRSRVAMNAWKTVVADSRANQRWDHPRPVGTWTFSARRTKSLNFKNYKKYKKNREIEVSRSKTIRFARRRLVAPALITIATDTESESSLTDTISDCSDNTWYTTCYIVRPPYMRCTSVSRSREFVLSRESRMRETDELTTLIYAFL